MTRIINYVILLFNYFMADQTILILDIPFKIRLREELLAASNIQLVITSVQRIRICQTWRQRNNII